MKALTNILNYILLLMMILIASCTEDAAEVDNLVRGEEYVTVRMQVPGMQSVVTRATAEDNITSVVALIFRDGNLDYNSAVSNLVTTSSTTGTFSIPKPKKDDVIHFLANVPNDVDLSGIKIESDLSSLTTGERDNLSYWGKAVYDGTSESLTVPFYRHLAMITIAPDSEEGTYPQEELFIAGLLNANQTGVLIPNEEGDFNFDCSENDYYTLPKNPDPLYATPLLSNNNTKMDNFVYVFEHDNNNPETPNTNEALYVICKIGESYYKVALVNKEGEPYDIIRNHKYTIYVQDFDEIEYEVPDDITEKWDIENYKYNLAKESVPINLTVIETKDVVFSPNTDQTINLNGYLDVQMNAYDRTLSTLSISADGFTVSSTNGSLSGPTDNVYTYTGGSTTFRFTPNSLGTKTISFYNGQGEYLSVPETVFNVNVQGLISASADKTDLYYNATTEQTVTVTVSVPAGVENLTIEAPEFGLGGDTDGEYTYAMNSQTNVSLTFTLLKDKVSQNEHQSYITIKDAGGIATQGSVSINVKSVPTVSFSDPGHQTLYWNNGNPTSFQVQMTDVPQNGSVTVNITGASAFTITDANSNVLQLNGDNYTYTGGNTTFTIKPKDANSVRDAAYTIGFSGTGDGVNVVPAEVSVTVKASSSALFATSGTINMDNSETSTTITLTKPGSVQNVSVNITDANGSKANRLFTINVNNNNLYYDQNNDNFNNISDYNNTVSIPITFAVKDNAIITSGEYTATFTGNYNGQNITATATITIVKTPDLQYSYTNNATLYLNDGNGSPTTLPVTITVPDGSTLTQLNITATGFIIKQGETTLSESGSYTYTGGSTTFTFVPTSTGSKTISFSGSGTNLNVPNKTISVNVEDTKPAVTETVLWSYTGEGTGQQLNPYNHFSSDNNSIDISSIKVGDTLGFDFSISTYNANNTYILIMNNGMYMALSSQFAIAEGKTNYEHIITSDDYTTLMYNNNKNLGVRGSENVYLTRVYLKKKN